MQFCPNDGLLTYLKCEGSDIFYECHKCSQRINYQRREQDTCIFRQQQGNSMDDFARLMVNPHTLLDPTLPRIKMKCIKSAPQVTGDAPAPVEGCDNDEVIYYRHDPANMRHLFICTKCRHVWTYVDSSRDENSARVLFQLEGLDEPPDETVYEPPTES